MDSNFLGRFILRWPLVWAILLGWWWGTWTLFNQEKIVAGLVLGIGGPVFVTLLALPGFFNRPPLEEDDV